VPERGFARNHVPVEPKARAEATQVIPDADDAARIALFAGRFGRYTMLAGAAAFWSIAGLAVWLGARVVCPDGVCRVLDFDRELLVALHALQRPWLNASMAAATWLGSIWVLLPVALALALRYRRRGQRAEAFLLPLGVGGAWLLAHAGKLLAVRPRPDLYPALIAMPADPSFPSAHATQITAFAFAWILAAGSRPAWPVLAAAALITPIVAFSRPYLQVHFPSDVVVGMIAGAAWAIGLRLSLGARA
jgi:membrane-associated phospholipid phosphatase